MEPLVIDFHVHVAKQEWNTESYDDLLSHLFPDPVEREAFFEKYRDPAVFVDMLRENKVDYAVILAEYSPLTTGVASNELVAGFCRDYKELIPFANLNPYMHDDLGGTLRRLVEKDGFKGIKLYPTYQHFYPNDAKIYPLYETAQELGIPVLSHTGSSVFKNSRLKYGNPVLYDDVAVDFPELKLLLAHSGRMAWYDEAMMVTRLHKNLYLELSGLSIKRLLEHFPEMEKFSHKFIFGTDWPQISYPTILKYYNGLGLKPQALQNILGMNAAKILNLI